MKDMPTWAQVAATIGVPALIAFYLLGMIPGVRSPFDRISDELRASAQAMSDHERTARESLRVNRVICRGIWKGDPVAQSLCGRAREDNGHQ